GQARGEQRPGDRDYDDSSTHGWHPWPMIAATRDWNSGLATKACRTLSRVLAPLAISLIQNCTPARSPPRRRNALKRSPTNCAFDLARLAYSALPAKRLE